VEWPQGLAADRCREARRPLLAQVVVAVQPMTSVMPLARVLMLRLTQEQHQRAMAAAGQVRIWQEIPHAAGHRH